MERVVFVQRPLAVLDQDRLVQAGLRIGTPDC